MNNLLTDRPVVLASSSPRRLMLLRQVGVEPRVIVAEVEELPKLGVTDAGALVTANAALKARAVAAQLGVIDALIIGADTVVAQAGSILGKPADAAEACSMLRQLQGAQHTVFTGQCVIDGLSGQSIASFCQTEVRFCPMSEQQIQAYVATGEPLDKAGAYGMQAMGGLFVEGIRGDYSTVVGLSLPLLLNMVVQLAGNRR